MRKPQTSKGQKEDHEQDAKTFEAAMRKIMATPKELVDSKLKKDKPKE